MNYYRKDWILFHEIANDGGKYPEDLLTVKVKEDDPETNKHVPFIEETTDGYKVRVGKNEFHGNDKDHKVMFIDLFIDDLMVRKNIKIGEELSFEFKVNKGKDVKAVAFCNLHGLFLGKLNK
ncbi:MAG: hypothetical protein KAG04_00110 [Mycoplasmataceae bacterium]|nr:hypothetical protein [Mycoplasmataceae bacterium]